MVKGPLLELPFPKEGVLPLSPLARILLPRLPIGILALLAGFLVGILSLLSLLAALIALLILLAALLVLVRHDCLLGGCHW
jgi:hypothetical protein